MTNAQFAVNERKYNMILSSHGFKIVATDIKKEIVQGGLQALEVRLMDFTNEENLDVAAACDKILNIA